MNNSTHNPFARRAGIDPVNGFSALASVWGAGRSGPAPDDYPVNGKKAHCTATTPVNGNSPLTGRLLVMARRCRSQPLFSITESGHNGGRHE